MTSTAGTNNRQTFGLKLDRGSRKAPRSLEVGSQAPGGEIPEMREDGMRCGFSFAVGVVLLGLACAKPSLFQSWGQQLVEAPRQAARVDDVSLLLGVAPSRCDVVADPGPAIGVGLDPKKLRIDSVMPGSPAEAAGMQPGDFIRSIGGQSITSPQQGSRAIRQFAREGAPLEVETNRGMFSPLPRTPKAEQCYWEHRAGGVARSGGAAYVNQWGGSAGAGSSAYQRFFKASCRVHDGFVVACQSNWQE